MTRALWGFRLLRDPGGLSYPRLIADSLLVAAGMVAIVLATGSAWVRGHLAPLQTEIALTVLAGAVSLVITVLWLLVGRFSHDGRPAWGAAAFAVYGLIAVPATTVGSAVESGRAASGTARLVGHAVMAFMLVVACWAAVRDLRLRGRKVTDGTLLAVALAVPVMATLLSLLLPETALAAASSQPVRWSVAALWLTAAALHAYYGLAHGISPMYRSGLGILVVGLAHSYRIGTERPQSASSVDLTFSALRLFGVLVVFWGAYELARRAVRGIRDALIERQEEVLVAEDGLARRAVLNHEIRNGIAGIAGATEILSSSAGTTEQAALQTVVTAELTRLDELLKPDQQ